MASESLLEVDGIDVHYARRGSRDAAQVLHGIRFTVARGERVAIVGESGSGKSTLAKAVLGMLPAGGSVVGGGIRFLGEELVGASPERLRSLRGDRIGSIAQDAQSSLDPLMRVGDQAAEAITSHRRTTRAERRSAVTRAFAAAGLHRPEAVAHAYPHQLSGGMRQRVLIGAALVNDPELLIADEPTSALDATVQERILAHLDGLVRERALGLLIITHDFAVVTRHADRVIVLQNGRIVESGPVSQVLADPQHEYTRLLIAAVPSATGEPRSPRTPHPDPYVVVDAVSKHYHGAATPALNPLSVSIDQGSTLAIVGESGSGKSTLGGIVLGTLRPDSGRVLVEGRDLAVIGRRTERAFRREVQAIFQDPFGSLDPLHTVEQILLEPLDAARIGSADDRARLVRSTLEDVGLPLALLGARSRELSGGQSQRVAIARALVVKPRLLVCDEPVSSLDVVAQGQVLALLQRLQRERGLTLVFISHDLGVVRALADRVLVLQGGVAVELADADRLFRAPAHPYTRDLLAAAFGEATHPDEAAQPDEITQEEPRVP